MNALLLAALIAVESGGNAHAVGDGGRAVGVLQIHPVVVADVNRIAGTHYTLADRWSPVKSREICTLYLAHYCGPGASAEKMARCWNGGPRGHLKPATVGYWRKVSLWLVRQQLAAVGP